MAFPLASSAVEATFTPMTDLFVDSVEPVKGVSTSLVAAIGALEIVALTATGLTTFVYGTHTAAQAVIASIPATVIGQAVTYYAAGKFNHAALTWPSALDTLAKRKAFLAGTPLFVDVVTAGGTSAS